MALSVAAGMAAQEKSDIEVSYDYHHFHRTGREQNHQMILLANAKESKFYNPVSHYVDSLESTPEGKEIYKQMQLSAFTSGKMGSIPKKSVFLVVVKDAENKEQTVYDGVLGFGAYTYTEPLEAQQWQIGDSTKTVMGYECVMATCDYRGRHWTAWFAPEIPLSNGPWKLGGLPGLILEAAESEGQHSFTADGISQSGRTIDPVIGSENYEKVSRIDMLKTLRKFEEDPIGSLSTAWGKSIKVVGGVEIDKKLDFLETDYKKKR